MFQDTDDLKAYIVETYPEVTDHRIDADHWDLQCTVCKITRGFQVVERDVAYDWRIYTTGAKERIEDFDAAVAAHAVAMGCVLVTANVKHMMRVPGLEIEDWSQNLETT